MQIPFAGPSILTQNRGSETAIMSYDKQKIQNKAITHLLLYSIYLFICTTPFWLPFLQSLRILITVVWSQPPLIDRMQIALLRLKKVLHRKNICKQTTEPLIMSI